MTIQGAGDGHQSTREDNDVRLSILGFAGAMAFAFAGSTADAQQPKRGGTLKFAISAETPHYDCHGSETYATLHFAAPFYSTLLRFNLDEVPRDRRRSRAVLDGRARPDDLYVQAASEREIPRRHDAHLGRRQGDLRPPAQPADRRGVAPQGDLRRHRHDRDAGPDHRHLQDEGGERLDDRALRLAVELHLRGQGPRRRPERAEDQDQRHRPVHLRRARQGQPRHRQAATTTTSSRACPISTASRASSRCRPPPCSTRCRAGRCWASSAASRRPSATAWSRPWATRCASRNRAGRSTCWSPSTPRRSRSTTCACAARCCWRSTAGAAAQACRASRRCARSAA